MRKTLVTAALVLVMTVGLGAVAGCTSGSQGADATTNTPMGTPPTMPATHEGRFDSLGANGCYGCHGANEQANPMLTGSIALPADHYAGGDAESMEFDPTHGQCITCHPQD